MTPTPKIGPPQRHPMRRFLNFWFAPGDPTILGFIRIVTGCLVLYTHLAYFPDLVNFFAADSWYDLATVNRERREMPNVSPSLHWEDPDQPETTAKLPEYPHRRSVTVHHLRQLSTDGSVAGKLAFLDRFWRADDTARQNRSAPGQMTADGVLYLLSLEPDARDRVSQLTVLADESRRAEMIKTRIPDLVVPPAPPLVTGLPAAERAKLPAEVLAFWETLPTTRRELNYVLFHYLEMDHTQRTAWFNMARRLATLDPAERERQIEYFAYWNVDPAVVTRFGASLFSFWFHVYTPSEMYALHWAIIGVIFLFTLGICTRITSVLTWICVVSYMHRDMHILFGMDTMMNILLFYLMIGDSGAALSIDRLVRRYRAARAAIAVHGKLDSATLAYLAAPPASVSAGFALRLIQVHFCFIYLASGMSKLKGNAWWNHGAYWDTLSNPEFTGIYYKWYEDFLRWVVSSRPVYSILAAFGVGYTFICELGLPFLVWTRLRPVMVVLAVGFHAGIAAFMGLVVFSLFMLTLLLAYLPGAAIRAVLFNRPKPAERVRVRFAPEVAAQRRAAALVAAFDLDGRTDLVAGPDAGSLAVEQAAGLQTGPAALALLTENVPMLKFVKPVLLIPAAGRIFTGTARPTPTAPRVAKRSTAR